MPGTHSVLAVSPPCLLLCFLRVSPGFPSQRGQAHKKQCSRAGFWGDPEHAQGSRRVSACISVTGASASWSSETEEAGPCHPSSCDSGDCTKPQQGGALRPKGPGSHKPRVAGVHLQGRGSEQRVHPVAALRPLEAPYAPPSVPSVGLGGFPVALACSDLSPHS